MPRVQFLFVCLAFLAAGCSETFESRYFDWKEAKQDGAFERGWLPDWLPPSARDIKEIHNIDTNKGAFSFSVQTGWSPREIASCGPSFDAPAPSVSLRQFPPNVEQRPDIIKCSDVFVLVMGSTVFAWR
jgi:hypothetical protein